MWLSTELIIRYPVIDILSIVRLAPVIPHRSRVDSDIDPNYTRLHLYIRLCIIMPNVPPSFISSLEV
jgi:hypothetical protein